jgi:hypothetical protein
MFLQSYFNEFAGSSSADQVMLQERLAVPFDPFNQVFLAIVMRDERDVLDFFHGMFSFGKLGFQTWQFPVWQTFRATLSEMVKKQKIFPFFTHSSFIPCIITSIHATIIVLHIS